MQIIIEYACGADCVGGGEIYHALDIKCHPNQIALAGVGGNYEINPALKHNIFCFNCELSQEIEVINEHARQAGKIVPIPLCLNPNVHADTRPYINMGLNKNTFGIIEEYLDMFL